MFKFRIGDLVAWVRPSESEYIDDETIGLRLELVLSDMCVSELGVQYYTVLGIFSKRVYRVAVEYLVKLDELSNELSVRHEIKK